MNPLHTGMAKARGLRFCDICLLLLGAVGAVMGSTAMLFGHYREAEPESLIGWPLRKYYIKKVTDKAMKPSITWKSLKQDTCAKYEAAQMKYGNPSGQVIAKILTETIPLPLCGVKPNCREHMSERCIYYDFAVDNGLIVMLCNAGSFLMLGLAGFCLMISNKPHWKMYAGTFCFLGGLLQVGSVGYWAYDTDKFQKRLIKQSLYPYAALNGWGTFTNVGGGALMCVAGVCGYLSSCFTGGRSKAGNDAFMGVDPLMAGPFGGQPLAM